RGRVSDIDPLGVGAEWVKSDAKRVVKVGGIGFRLLGLAILSDSTINKNLSRAAVREKEIAVRRGANEARVFHAIGVKFHLEASRSLWPGILGTVYQGGVFVHRSRRVRLRKIGNCDFMDCSGVLRGVTKKRRRPAG